VAYQVFLYKVYKKYSIKTDFNQHHKSGICKTYLTNA